MKIGDKFKTSMSIAHCHVVTGFSTDENGVEWIHTIGDGTTYKIQFDDKFRETIMELPDDYYVPLSTKLVLENLEHKV